MPPRTAASGTARKPRASRQLAAVQRAASDSDALLPPEEKPKVYLDGRVYVTLAGKDFLIQEKVGLMPLMMWVASNDGISPTSGNSALASLFHVLEDVVDPEDWTGFVKHTSAAKCEGEEFGKFVNAAIEGLAALPTQVPASS